jgi:transketolase
MLDQNLILNLKNQSQKIRRQVIKVAAKHKAAHLGSALSVVDILTVLYFQILKIDPRNPNWPKRDRLILSKGHAALALYATLATRGFAQETIINDYYAEGKKLAVHPVIYCMPGVEVSTGSLGHGLSMGVGMAYAAKLDEKDWRTFVILSDGECNEGSTWEAIMSAAQFRLDNLIAIVDYNKYQGFGQVKEVMDLEPFKAKWQSFGWQVVEIDGHNFNQLIEVLSRVPFKLNQPSVIIAHTIKGKGIPSLENTFESHYLVPDKKELKKILDELS